MTTQNVFQFLTILCCGLIAGLLYSYSCSVNLGLKTLADNDYIRAMKAINIAIQNPLFFIVFMGLLFVFPVSVYLTHKQQSHSSFYYMLSAMIVYFVAVFGVTIFCNVPLNEQLAKFPVSTATTGEISAMRHSFEKLWILFHTVRTAASIISFGLAILSLFKSKF